jgi:hypothetical protein
MSTMVQGAFIGHHQAAKMKIVIVEKEVDEVSVKGQLALANFCPLGFEIRGELMAQLYLSNPLCDLAAPIFRAPDCAKNHGLMAIVLQMA